MAGIKMNVEFPTRLCEVNGKLGYFHRWEQWSKVVDASPLRGGHPGGQNTLFVVCETLKTLGRKAIAARNVLMGKKNVAENASKISALAPTISNS